jgi:hypothetical protein
MAAASRTWGTPFTLYHARMTLPPKPHKLTCALASNALTAYGVVVFCLCTAS